MPLISVRDPRAYVRLNHNPLDERMATSLSCNIMLSEAEGLWMARAPSYQCKACPVHYLRRGRGEERAFIPLMNSAVGMARSVLA